MPAETAAYARSSASNDLLGPGLTRRVRSSRALTPLGVRFARSRALTLAPHDARILLRERNLGWMAAGWCFPRFSGHKRSAMTSERAEAYGRLMRRRWRHGAAELLVRDLEACGPLAAVS